MSWETHEAAKRIADGWYAELEDTRKRNAVLGRENAKLREELTAEHALAETLGHYHELEQAENAKLRTQLADVTESMGRVEGRCAKLRELVRDMHAVISDRNSWWDCMCKDTRRFADRMRELGIEAEQ